MRISPDAVALVAIVFPLLASAQNESVQVQSIRADEQIILSQIMTEKRAIYAQAMQLTDEESRAFWPVAHRQRTAARGHATGPARPMNRGARTISTLTEPFR
jgi:hypothetical protein